MISVNVLQYYFERFVRLARDQLSDALPRPQDFLRLNGDIAGFPADAAARLVNQESSIWQAEATLARRRQVDVGCGAAHPSGADHPHRGADEPNQVVNGVARF